MDSNSHTPLKPVEALKARKFLQDQLQKTSSRSCGIGLLNFTKSRYFDCPRVYIKTGEVFARPPSDEKITSDMAGVAIFQKSDWALHGSSGVLSFNVESGKSGEHQITLAILWETPYSSLYTNRFNVRMIPRGMPVDEKLWNMLLEDVRPADEVIDVQQEGITIHASMTKDSRALLTVECRTPEDAPVGPFFVSEVLRAGKELQEKLRQWVGECEAKNCCAIGIDNWTHSHTLRNPRLYIDTGACIYSPADRVDPKMGCASLFKKKDYALSGTSGVMTHDIDDTHRLCIMWEVPFSSGVVMPNRFNVRLVQPTVECDEELYTSMRHNSRLAKDGPITIKDKQFHIQAEMGDEPKAILSVCFSEPHSE